MTSSLRAEARPVSPPPSPPPAPELRSCFWNATTASAASGLPGCSRTSSTSTSPIKAAGNSGGVRFRPFQIPLRACVARDAGNLYMAGRRISGDFHAHASYRVTGSAVAIGEAVGKAAASAIRS